MRLFFAIELHEAIRAEATHYQDELRSELAGLPYKWTDPKLFHVTMAFLGEVSEEDVGTLEAQTRAVCENHGCTSLAFQGLKCFSSPKRPRVLWIAGNEPNQPVLKELGKELYRVAEAVAPKAKAAEVIPHITLARLNVNSNKTIVDSVAKAMAESQSRSFGSMPVREISLMRSNLRNPASRYETVSRFPLGT